jgi:phosphate transport system permease protein
MSDRLSKLSPAAPGPIPGPPTPVPLTPSAGPSPSRKPSGRIGLSSISMRPAGQLVGSGVSAFALVWLLFHLAGLDAPFGLLVCWLAVFVALYGVITWRSEGALLAKDRLGSVFVCIGAIIAFLPLVAVIAFVAVKGWPVVSARFPHFLTTDLSRSGAADPITSGGMKAAIIGTVEQVGLATVITTPLAILTAIYLSENTTKFARSVSTVVDAMSGVPAIIAGLFVYLVWVLPRHRDMGGFSGWAATMALTIVMIPTVTRTAEEVLRTVPRALREAAMALGAPRWRTTLQVVLPTARSGLITAVVLGLARAVGETAPVLFTAHGATATNVNLFHGPQADLPLEVFQLILLPSSRQNDQAWGGALVLIVLVLILFIVARIVGSGRRGGIRTFVATRRWTRGQP